MYMINIYKYIFFNSAINSYIYGRKSVDRKATQSLSKICNLWRFIMVDCDYAESYRRFLSGVNADGSHAVYIVTEDK